MLFVLFQILTSNTLKEYSTDIYEIKYDRSWRIKKKDKSKLTLKHSSKSKINIEVLDLEEYNDLLVYETYNDNYYSTPYGLYNNAKVVLKDMIIRLEK